MCMIIVMEMILAAKTPSWDTGGGKDQPVTEDNRGLAALSAA